MLNKINEVTFFTLIERAIDWQVLIEIDTARADRSRSHLQSVKVQNNI